MKKLLLLAIACVMGLFTMNAQETSFSYNFDDGALTGWRTFTASGHVGNGWEISPEVPSMYPEAYHTIYKGVDETNAVVSMAYKQLEGTACKPNCYIVTDSKYLVTATSKLSWFAKTPLGSPAESEQYYLVVSEDNETWTQVFGEICPVSADREYAFTSEYAGKELYIGFQHIYQGASSGANDAVVLDNIVLTVEEGGDDNTGDDNTGDDNTGDDNTGDDNTGDDNTGDDNTGDDNTGDDDEAYLIREYFDGFEAGDKIAEKGSAWWTTWNKKPGTKEDGVIAEIDGNKCAHMTYGNDQVLLLGGQQNGVYDLEFDILVPDGKGGYFNILHEFKGGNSVWAMQAYLQMTNDGGDDHIIAPGHGTLHAGGNSVADVPCVYDEWMHFRLHIDTDLDKAQYYYTAPGEEEVLVYEWVWSKDSFGENVAAGRKLDAMNFYPSTSSSEYYLDNFTLKKIGGESAPELIFSVESLEATAEADDMTSVELNLENTGTSIAEYVAWVDYGMGEVTETDTPIFINYDQEPGENTMPYGLNVTEEPMEIEIGAMYPATSYGNSAAGTYVTHVMYPFLPLAVNESIGLEEGTPVKFRIYGQGLYGQPGELLAEKVIPYEEIKRGEYTIAEFDAPVALTGYNVWATVAFTHAVTSDEDPQAPIIADGGTAAPYGDMLRFGSSGSFYKAGEMWGEDPGNFHIRMVCFGTPVTGGWAELDKTEGVMPIGAKETINVDLTTIGLKAGETYNANIIFTTNVAGKETVEIPLALNVEAVDNIEEVLSNTYNIYPNPASAQVTVEGENINYIAVYNSVGQLVNVVRNSNNVVDMSNYDNGVYYFNIVDNAGQSAVQRVVVAK